MILRAVTMSQIQGKNIRLHLACGHSILRGRRQIAKTPDRALCAYCPDPEEHNQ